jgi:hypothetical protein
MSNGIIVEFEGRDVGLVVRQPGERVYRFHAAQSRVSALDGSIFATSVAAHQAVARHLRTKAVRRD